MTASDTESPWNGATHGGMGRSIPDVVFAGTATSVFAGTRELGIEQLDGTVPVMHVEDVTGLLFPVFRAAMGSAVQKHHAALNRALKERTEGQTPA